ncbi:MAG: hypothetical protein WC628_02225 [Candidatus Omnitrophota bacterium]
MIILKNRVKALCFVACLSFVLSGYCRADIGQEPLTSAMTLFYRGEIKPVPQNSAEAKELEKATMDLLGTMRRIVLKAYPETENELKQKGICLEISFKVLTLIKSNSNGKPILQVLRVLIPLKGRSVGIETFEGKVTALHVFQEEVQTASSGPFGITASTDEIQKILQRMSLLPYKD